MKDNYAAAATFLIWRAQDMRVAFIGYLLQKEIAENFCVIFSTGLGSPLHTEALHTTEESLLITNQSR